MAQSDRHILLDVSVIVNLWLGSDSGRLVEDLFDSTRQQGVPLWISASSITTLDYVARKRFKQAGLDHQDVGPVVSRLMDNLFEDVRVLTNYGFEQEETYKGARDFEDAQIAVAARSLYGASVCLVSEDAEFDALGEISVLTPAEALAWLHEKETSTDPIPFIDLAVQQHRILPEIERGITGVLRHGQYIMGPEVAQLERMLAEFVGVKHAIACSSGTDALLLPLMAYGIGPGDAVFTTPFTFFATAEMIALTGATPVFVDIDPVTFNIDPEKLEQTLEAVVSGKWSVRSNTSSESRVTSPLKPKAIIPVDLFGLPADYDRIMQIAEKHGLKVIEDAAQAFGAVYKGRRAPGLAHVGATSFFPAKPMGCYGDGGAVFTDDDELAAIIRSLVVHGKGNDKYNNIRIGLNARLDTIQAVILIEKLKVYPEEIELRQQVATRYTEALRNLSDAGIIVPAVPDGCISVWAQYTIRCSGRDVLQEKLKEAGIPTMIYYVKPIHLLKAMAFLAHKEGDFLVS